MVGLKYQIVLIAHTTGHQCGHPNNLSMHPERSTPQYVIIFLDTMGEVKDPEGLVRHTSTLDENLSPPVKDLLLLPVPYPELLLERGGEKLLSYLK